jgi:hypothetical protein
MGWEYWLVFACLCRIDAAVAISYAGLDQHRHPGGACCIGAAHVGRWVVPNSIDGTERQLLLPHLLLLLRLLLLLLLPPAAAPASGRLFRLCCCCFCCERRCPRHPQLRRLAQQQLLRQAVGLRVGLPKVMRLEGLPGGRHPCVQRLQAGSKGALAEARRGELGPQEVWV